MYFFHIAYLSEIKYLKYFKGISSVELIFVSPEDFRNRIACIIYLDCRSVKGNSKMEFPKAGDILCKRFPIIIMNLVRRSTNSTVSLLFMICIGNILELLQSRGVLNSTSQL